MYQSMQLQGGHRQATMNPQVILILVIIVLSTIHNTLPFSQHASANQTTNLPIISNHPFTRSTSDGKKRKRRKGSTPSSDITTKTTLVGGLRALCGALPTTVHLLFSLPADNGGAPILGYHVYALVHSDQVHHRTYLEYI